MQVSFRVILMFLYVWIVLSEKQKKFHCANFNDIAVRAARSGVNNVFTCMSDRIPQSICAEPFPLKSVFSSVKPALSWKDFVFFILVSGKGIRTAVIHWWLQFLTITDGDFLDIVLISDACPQQSTGELLAACDDAATHFANAVRNGTNPLYKGLRVNVVRGLPVVDAGYGRLACKLATGAAQIYRLFPERRYFFKLDDDSVVFPSRLLRLVSALHAGVRDPIGEPLYFGSVSHLHKPSVPLCGELGWMSTDGSDADADVSNQSLPLNVSALSSAGYATYQWRNGSIAGRSLCYAQGGAGYGLNNLAMRSLASTPPCTEAMDLESPGEDAWVAFKLFRDLRATLIHCGSLRPSGVQAEAHLGEAVSFHHVSDRWMATRNVTDMRARFADLA